MVSEGPQAHPGEEWCVGGDLQGRDGFLEGAFEKVSRDHRH